MSRVGCTHADATAERLRTTLEPEEVDDPARRDLDAVERTIGPSIGAVHDRQRLRSALASRVPAEFEADLLLETGASVACLTRGAQSSVFATRHRRRRGTLFASVPLPDQEERPRSGRAPSSEREG